MTCKCAEFTDKQTFTITESILYCTNKHSAHPFLPITYDNMGNIQSPLLRFVHNMTRLRVACYNASAHAFKKESESIHMEKIRIQRDILFPLHIIIIFIIIPRRVYSLLPACACLLLVGGRTSRVHRLHTVYRIDYVAVCHF